MDERQRLLKMRQETNKRYYQKIKGKPKLYINCHICNKELVKSCLKRHIILQHPPQIRGCYECLEEIIFENGIIPSGRLYCNLCTPNIESS